MDSVDVWFELAEGIIEGGGGNIVLLAVKGGGGGSNLSPKVKDGSGGGGGRDKGKGGGGGKDNSFLLLFYSILGSFNFFTNNSLAYNSFLALEKLSLLPCSYYFLFYIFSFVPPVFICLNFACNSFIASFIF